MPFGLQNAPAMFQCLVNHVVGDMESCTVYVDDVVVFSDTWDVYIQQMWELFTCLAEARLIVNLANCCQVVGQGRVCPVDAKVRAVEQFPAPTIKK